MACPDCGNVKEYPGIVLVGPADPLGGPRGDICEHPFHDPDKEPVE